MQQISAAEHDHAVLQISQQMREVFSRGTKVKIFHGSTNSTRKQQFDPRSTIDISGLNRIIEINPEERTIIVEPNVPMDALVEATLQHNLIPPVVMEFPGITVGGGIQGGAGESSSAAYGLFHETCLEYEIILGTGERVIASPSQHPDLFHGTACTYGTIGIITRAKIRLIPAKKFVTLTYHRQSSYEDAVSFTTDHVKTGVHFIDAIFFERTRGVVMVGELSETATHTLAIFTRAKDDWFYLHADDISKNHELYTESIPLRDYLFRYDRGAFWMGKYGFDFLHVPFNAATRYIANRFIRTRELYASLHAADFSQRYLVQDIAFPRETAAAFLEKISLDLNIFPLWFVPAKVSTSSPLSSTYLPTDLIISVGIWGEAHVPFQDFVALNRSLEKATSEHGGRKWLYGHQYYTREEFWSIFDRSWYSTMRQRYQAESTFPDIYDKVTVTKQYRPSVWRGVWKNIQRTFKWDKGPRRVELESHHR